MIFLQVWLFPVHSLKCLSRTRQDWPHSPMMSSASKSTLTPKSVSLDFILPLQKDNVSLFGIHVFFQIACIEMLFYISCLTTGLLCEAGEATWHLVLFILTTPENIIALSQDSPCHHRTNVLRLRNLVSPNVIMRVY